MFLGGQRYTRNTTAVCYLPRNYAKWSFSLSVTRSASKDELPKEAVCSTETDVLLFLFQELFLPLLKSLVYGRVSLTRRSSNMLPRAVLAVNTALLQVVARYVVLISVSIEGIKNHFAIVSQLAVLAKHM